VSAVFGAVLAELLSSTTVRPAIAGPARCRLMHYDRLTVIAIIGWFTLSRLCFVASIFCALYFGATPICIVNHRGFAIIGLLLHIYYLIEASESWESVEYKFITFKVTMCDLRCITHSSWSCPES